MKKVFGVLLGLLFCLLFFVILSLYIEEDRYLLYQKFGVHEDYHERSISFKQPLTLEEKDKLIKRIKEAHEKEGWSFVYSFYKQSGDTLEGIEHFVYGDDTFIAHLLPEGVDIPKEFSNQKNILSSKEGKGTSFFTFYQSLYYSLIPFHEVRDYPENYLREMTLYNDKGEEIITEKQIREYFGEFGIDLVDYSGEVFHKDEALIKEMKAFSLLFIILFAVLILFSLSERLKDVAILKMQGFNTRHILTYLYKKDILMTLLISLLLPWMGTLLYYRELNRRLLGFIRTLSLIGIAMVALFILMTILSSALIKRYSLSHFLKKKNLHSPLTTLCFLLLLFASLAIIPLLHDPSLLGFEQGYELMSASRDLKDTEGITELLLGSDPERLWEYDPLKDLEGIPSDGNQRNKAFFNALEDKEALLLFRERLIFPESTLEDDIQDRPYIAYEINDQYLHSLEMTYQGERINISNPQDLNILMDEKTYQKEIWAPRDFGSRGGKTTIYLMSSIDYRNLSLESIKPFENEEFPIFIYTTDEKLLSKNVRQGGIYIEKGKEAIVRDYLNENGIEAFILKDTSQKRVQLRDALVTLIKELFMMILPGLISISSLTLSFSYFYGLAYEKEMRVLKSMGYKKQHILKPFILELILLIAICSSYFFFFNGGSLRISLSYLLALMLLSLIYEVLFLRNIHLKDL